MKFSLKNFLLGMGTGVITISLLFYCVYSFSSKPENPLEIVKALPEQAVTERAKELGMIFAKELPAKSDVMSMTDESIIEKAKELGMIFEDRPDSLNDNGQETETDRQEEAYVEVTIPEGSNANEVAELLKEKGIVDDADSFSQFLADRQVTKKLHSGDFLFPINGDYELILQIALRNDR